MTESLAANLQGQIRAKLPNRRWADVLAFEHGGISFMATIGFYPDNVPGEIFLEGGKPGTPMRDIARDLAVTASLAMQYGCPPHVLQKALTRNDDGSAAGPLGRLLDLISAQDSLE